MGVLPLQFRDGESAASLGLSGHEVFTITGLAAGTDGPLPPTVTVHADGRSFPVTLRLDTPREHDYIRHGGIMRYVLRRMAGAD
jgi:aconitate hydratase A / 2-methylisocitrate dehydratase